MPSMRKHQPSPSSDDNAGKRWADEPGEIDDGRVEGDGVAEVALVLDHLDHERLAAGHVKCVDEPLEDAEREDFRDGDAMRERERGKGQRLQGGEHLRPDEHGALVPAIDPDSGEGRQQKSRNLPREADDAEQPCGPGEAIDEPTGGDARHPGADERDALPTEEQPEVGRAQRPPRTRNAARLLTGVNGFRGGELGALRRSGRHGIIQCGQLGLASVFYAGILWGHFAISSLDAAGTKHGVHGRRPLAPECHGRVE